MSTQRCRCPGERPLTVATFRNATLVSVVRHHLLPCRLGDDDLDRINWQPRPGPPPAVTHQPPPRYPTRPGWPQRPERPPEPPDPRPRWKPRTDRQWPSRR